MNPSTDIEISTSTEPIVQSSMHVYGGGVLHEGERECAQSSVCLALHAAAGWLRRALDEVGDVLTRA
jgi:hypothetical protein